MKGYRFFIATTLVICVQFVKTLTDSQVIGIMDFGGWAFYITSCISHAACLALIPFMLYAIFCLLRLYRIGQVIMIMASVMLSAAIAIDEQVYLLYRFHINGFVVNMLTGPAAGEIFNFDVMLYAKYTFMLTCLVAVYTAAWYLSCGKGWQRIAGKMHLPTGKMAKTFPMCVIVACSLFAHGYHVFAAFYAKPSVVQSERLLPYYFPTTDYGFMTETLGLYPVKQADVDIPESGSNMRYPRHSLRVEQSGERKWNILIVLLDSWNPRALTEECMPNVYKYAMENQWYRNHLSGSNGTKSGVFSLWYSIPSYYWDLAESSHTIPAVLSVAHMEGYVFRNFPSATHIDPPFAKVLFAKEKNLRVSTPGKTSYDRDCQITKDIIHFLKGRKASDAPFISFLFYDLPHSFEYRKEYARFQPSWTYADYSRLSNSMDATPFWNLYRNTCYATDRNIAQVLAAIKETGHDKNTVVIITGDHSQEFNENRKNYWGHNGNFSKAQIQVPLITHFPGDEAQAFTHRTTHYDIMPTIMKRVMGVRNEESDYSLGFLLSDRRSRNWHIVGSELNYGFIVEGDTILEKDPSGTLSVYDSHMNIVNNYHLVPGKLKTALDKMYHFLVSL